jgi:polyphosphate kinase 2 (PPK2 family)
MFLRTSTPAAPWTVVEAEDKYYARVKVLRTVADAIERRLS